MLTSYKALDDIETHGQHFSFDNLLVKHRYYIENFDTLYSSRNWSELEHLWCDEIGGEQCMLPAWVVMMMCEEGEDVAWRHGICRQVERETKHLTTGSPTS